MGIGDEVVGDKGGKKGDICITFNNNDKFKKIKEDLDSLGPTKLLKYYYYLPVYNQNQGLLTVAKHELLVTMRILHDIQLWKQCLARGDVSKPSQIFGFVTVCCCVTNYLKI